MIDIAYHYTSPDGILGILQDKALRFTDCQFLNDRGEATHILDPLREAYEIISKEREGEVINLEYLIARFSGSPYENERIKINYNPSSGCKEKGFGTQRYYVLCTSLNSDTANMWNYYVKNGKYHGYNLGIKCSCLKDMLLDCQDKYRQFEFTEGKIIYDRQEQVKVIYDKLDKLYAQLGNSKDEVDSLNFQSELFCYLNQQKLFFKHPAFSCEEEYRFVIIIDKDLDNDYLRKYNLSTRFRAGESGIITPYIELKYALSEKEELFKEITLAPMIETPLAEESFKRFLASTVKQNIEIKSSSITLRF